MSSFNRPVSGDYAEYFELYLDHLAAGGQDILEILEDQAGGILRGLRALTEEQSNHTYAPGKWSIKELLGHLIDMERLLVFRALWIARDAENLQPGVDENLWAANSNAGRRPLAELTAEFQTMRESHLQLFRSFDESARKRRGIVDGFSTTANSIPWLVAAHEGHHLVVLKDRYGVDLTS